MKRILTATFLSALLLSAANAMADAGNAGSAIGKISAKELAYNKAEGTAFLKTGVSIEMLTRDDGPARVTV